MKAVDEYTAMYCNELGEMKGSQVLTEKEELGRKEIIKGVKHSGWMVYNSDKSGRVVLDTIENFLNGMSEHYVKDPIVTYDDVRKGEITLNDHVKMWCKCFNIGGATNARRCARALASNYVMIPVLQGLRKDHTADRNGDPNL